MEAAAFIAKYDWVEVVGAGSYSSVHRAFEKRTGRPVAIKVIKKEILTPDVEAQIINEAVSRKQSLLSVPLGRVCGGAQAQR